MILKREILGSHTISDQSLLLSTNVLNDYYLLFTDVSDVSDITEDGSSSSFNLIIIVGGVVAVIIVCLLLCIIIGIVLFFKRKKRKHLDIANHAR